LTKVIFKKKKKKKKKKVIFHRIGVEFAFQPTIEMDDRILFANLTKED
jgi:hypothetical protein